MNTREAAALLAVAAAFDNRKPDADAAQAWSIALGDIRFQDARDAVVAHYRVSSEWLMPAKVISEVKRIRSKRIAEAGDPTPPPDLNPMQTIEWLRERNRRVGDGESPDDVAAYGELKKRHLPDLMHALPAPDRTTSPAHTERRETDEETTA